MNNKIYNSTLLFLTIFFSFAIFINARYSYFFPIVSITLLLGIMGREKYGSIISGVTLLYAYVIFGFNQKFLMKIRLVF